MPEGPSIVILKEAVRKFKRKKIQQAKGNAKIDMDALTGKSIVEFKSWGKQFFIVMKGAVVRIHFLLWGSYSIDEVTRPDKSIRLHLKFTNGDLYFYTCSVKMVDEAFLNAIDWRADVMSDEWSATAAVKKLKAQPEMLACDALLDQEIFSGVGNIIKNEVLFRIGVHPLSEVGKMPAKKLKQLVDEARKYSFDFYKWKKEFVLKKNWLMHTKKVCPTCAGLVSLQHLGKTNRRSFYCEHCQQRY